MKQLSDDLEKCARHVRDVTQARWRPDSAASGEIGSSEERAGDVRPTAAQVMDLSPWRARPRKLVILEKSFELKIQTGPTICREHVQSCSHVRNAKM